MWPAQQLGSADTRPPLSSVLPSVLCRSLGGFVAQCCFANIVTVQPSPDDYGTELLQRYHENLSEIFTDKDKLLKMISRAKSVAPGEREVRAQWGVEAGG